MTALGQQFSCRIRKTLVMKRGVENNKEKKLQWRQKNSDYHCS